MFLEIFHDVLFGCWVDQSCDGVVFLDEGSDECAAYELKFGFGGHEYGVEIRVDETVDVGLVFLRLEVGGVPAPLDDEVDANPPAGVCSESTYDGDDLYVREVT